MPERIVSKWAKGASIVGLLWLVVALAAAVADFMHTRRAPDPQGMFGGHIIALSMLWVAQVPAAVVIVCGLIAAIRSWLRLDVAAGWPAIGVGVLGVVVGCGLLFLVFVQ